MPIISLMRHFLWLIPWSVFAQLAVRRRKIFVWPHLGLGDTISMACALEKLSSEYEKVFVACRDTNLAQLRTIYSYIPNLVFYPLGSVRPSQEPFAILRIAFSLRLLPVICGHALFFLIWFAKISHRDFNGVLSACLGWSGGLTSMRMQQHISTIAQDSNSLPRQQAFAFVDHHPNSQREIPQSFLNEIEGRLPLRQNSLELSFKDLLANLSLAKELHLVSSAPLCIALTADLGNAGNRFAYVLSDYAPIARDYPKDWVLRYLDTGEIDKSRSESRGTKALGNRILKKLLVIMFPFLWKIRREL
jgi:hypothetical protein